MAIWQFNLTLIPKSSILSKYYHIPSSLFIDKDAWENLSTKSDLEEAYDFEDALTINWWENLKISVNQLLYTLKNIPETPSNYEGLRYFGSADSNDLCVSYGENTNQVEEISCRVDLRKLDQNFINSILSLAEQFDCLLMDRQGRLFEPIKNQLIEAIKLSNSYRFVINPEQFLNDLSSGVVNPE